MYRVELYKRIHNTFIECFYLEFAGGFEYEDQSLQHYVASVESVMFHH